MIGSVDNHPRIPKREILQKQIENLKQQAYEKHIRLERAEEGEKNAKEQKVSFINSNSYYARKEYLNILDRLEEVQNEYVSFIIKERA